MFVRDALTELTRHKRIAIQRGPRKREEGFQTAVFCPIPIGDSPSSKRLYDVVNVSFFASYCSFCYLLFLVHSYCTIIRCTHVSMGAFP